MTFEKMNKLELSSDKKIASFQPGHTWFDVYTELGKENLAVIGGRVSQLFQHGQSVSC